MNLKDPNELTRAGRENAMNMVITKSEVLKESEINNSLALCKKISGVGMLQWEERSSLTNVARVHFDSGLVPYVG